MGAKSIAPLAACADMLTSSGFEPQSSQAKNCKIGIC